MKGALVTVLAMCACVHAGVYYEAEENRQGPRGKVGLVIKRTCYVSGAKARIENTTPFGSDVVILRFDTGMRYNLRPRHKDCMTQELPKPDPRVRVTVTKTEETKKIGPYTCTRYDATVDGRTIRYWMTTEVKLGEEGATFWRSLAPLQPTKLVEEMARSDAFPILVEISSPQGTVVTTITTVKKQDIPDSMFGVPTDYQVFPKTTTSGRRPTRAGPNP